MDPSTAGPDTCKRLLLDTPEGGWDAYYADNKSSETEKKKPAHGAGSSRLISDDAPVSPLAKQPNKVRESAKFVYDSRHAVLQSVSGINSALRNRYVKKPSIRFSGLSVRNGACNLHQSKKRPLHPRNVHTFSHVFQARSRSRAPGTGTSTGAGTGAGAMQPTCSIIVAPPPQYEFCPPRPLSVCHAMTISLTKRA